MMPTSAGPPRWPMGVFSRRAVVWCASTRGAERGESALSPAAGMYVIRRCICGRPGVFADAMLAPSAGAVVSAGATKSNHASTQKMSLPWLTVGSDMRCPWSSVRTGTRRIPATGAPSAVNTSAAMAVESTSPAATPNTNFSFQNGSSAPLATRVCAAEVSARPSTATLATRPSIPGTPCASMTAMTTRAAASAGVAAPVGDAADMAFSAAARVEDCAASLSAWAFAAWSASDVARASSAALSWAALTASAWRASIRCCSAACTLRASSSSFACCCGCADSLSCSIFACASCSACIVMASTSCLASSSALALDSAAFISASCDTRSAASSSAFFSPSMSRLTIAFAFAEACPAALACHAASPLLGEVMLGAGGLCAGAAAGAGGLGGAAAAGAGAAATGEGTAAGGVGAAAGGVVAAAAGVGAAASSGMSRRRPSVREPVACSAVGIVLPCLMWKTCSM
mmetsp:Transcript_54152/g.128220  ORF Transcript_54152/g.128220 Transcript_54152/m.128220 type:complete len:459 (+) Transcript_54152:147-1523(+)